MSIEFDDHALGEYERNLIRVRDGLDNQFKKMVKKAASLVLEKAAKTTNTSDALKNEQGQTVRVGGTLRRGWTADSESEAESGSQRGVSEYVAKAKVVVDGKEYSLDITNPVHYASYVEFGHRQEVGRFVPAIGKRLKKPWVEGQFILTNAMKSTNNKFGRVMEKQLQDYLTKELGDD